MVFRGGYINVQRTHIIIGLIELKWQWHFGYFFFTRHWHVSVIKCLVICSSFYSPGEFYTNWICNKSYRTTATTTTTAQYSIVQCTPRKCIHTHFLFRWWMYFPTNFRRAYSQPLHTIKQTQRQAIWKRQRRWINVWNTYTVVIIIQPDLCWQAAIDRLRLNFMCV